MLNYYMFQDYKNLIENELRLFLSNTIDKINVKEPFIKSCFSLIKDFTLSGGKRLRPIALIVTYSTLTKEEKKIYLPAIAVELFHVSSLILDDLMDESDCRRGNDTLHKTLIKYFTSEFKERSNESKLYKNQPSRFSVSFSIMIGNLINNLSKKAIFISEFPYEMRENASLIIDRTQEKIYFGQMIDILHENKIDISENDYLDMIKMKTATMFGMAFELGSLFASVENEQRAFFRMIGINLGLSFQIKDDINDFISDKKKDNGLDIKLRKKTLPIIKALEFANHSDKKTLKFLYTKNELNNRDISRIQDIVYKSKAIDYCENLAIQKFKKAKNIIEGINYSSAIKSNFINYCDLVFNSYN